VYTAPDFSPSDPKLRIGLDMHGVITDDPNFFSDLARMLIDHDNEVYIVTGREDCDELQGELRECNMINRDGKLYSSILSITTYQKGQGIPISYLDGRLSQPMMDPSIWNPTKAMLCATAGVDIMIDDSVLYESYFKDIKTQYITYTPKMKAFLQRLFYYGGYKL